MRYFIYIFFFIALATSTRIAHGKYLRNSNQSQFSGAQQTRTVNSPCTTDSNCADHEQCRNSLCQCEDGYIVWGTPNNTCSYKQIPKLVGFLVSFFVGNLGIDWFVLSKGDGGYITAGVFKLLMSCGCCIMVPFIVISAIRKSATWGVVGYILTTILTLGASVWWLVDWIRILANAFPDGNGAPLKGW